MPADNKSKSNVPEERVYRVRLLGTGASDPTKEVGNGVSVTRTGVGTFRAAFNDNPGTFIGFSWGLGAATPGDVKGHTVTRDTYTAPTASANAYVDLAMWNASEAADELNATEYLDLTFVFAATSAV